MADVSPAMAGVMGPGREPRYALPYALSTLLYKLGGTPETLRCRGGWRSRQPA